MRCHRIKLVNLNVEKILEREALRSVKCRT